MKHNRGRPKSGFIGCIREITAARGDPAILPGTRGDPATVRNNRDGPNEIGLIFTVLIGFFKLKWGSYVPNQ
jgi:hypothetical protein